MSNYIEIPWHCGNDDGCTQGWHLALYDYDETGELIVSSYADGDWEPADREAPTYEEARAAWREYAESVARTGVDPLRNYRLPIAPDRKRDWQVCYRHSLRGVVATGFRRRGRCAWRHPSTVPAEVLQYFLAERSATNPSVYEVNAWPHLDAIESELSPESYKYKRRVSALELRITCVVDEHPQPWSDERIASYLRRAARRDLRELHA